MPTTAPYGSWRSPITPDLIVAGATSLGQVAWDGPDLYWVEMRPDEGGRMVVVRRSALGEIDDITPKPFSVRTRVHEYGGGAFLVDNGVVYFSDYADQRLYRQDPGNAPRPITPEAPLRYADGVIDRRLGRIICVREDHSGPGEPVNAIVAVDITGECPQQVLYSSSDFCSTPRLSPDGASLAWLTWDHPNMPWDGTELLVAAVDEQGRLGAQRLVAGGKNESIFQPGWSPAGELHFVSDRTGWWNLYRRRGCEIQSLAERTAEFGKPQWTFDSATYGFLDEDRIACCYNTLGSWSLAVLNTGDGSMTALDSGDSGDAPYSEMGRGDLKAGAGRVAFVAGGPAEAMSLVIWEPSTDRTETVRRSHLPDVDVGYLSAPSPVEFPTGDGKTAHAFYYPPANRDYSAPAGDKPPLLIKSHGGPTAAASTALDLGIQFWTSRGFAVADVNYGGSTGYGTEYRRRLNGAWGVVDVEDCVSAALYLAERGYADPERLAIDGGSAGGYTTLAALTFRDVFQAGTSLYGVSDLEALAKETHKFESRYLDSLVGPYPERRDLYQERSPINHTHLLSCPLLLLQGLEDEIVPPNQAVMMFEAVRAKGLPTAYLPFEGEQHGFRRAENIKRALEAELYFYSRVFRFSLADPIEPIAIENLG